MIDKSVPYVSLTMQHTNLLGCAVYALPHDYSLRFYKSGDEHNWARIETSSGEFDDVRDGLAAFDEYYGGKEEELKSRMVFLLDSNGTPIGTTTAWYSDDPQDGGGRLQWVAIDREHQSKHLAKPMITYAMALMAIFTGDTALLTTQTQSWKACNAYFSLGWRPYNDGNKDYKEGWQIVAEKSGNFELLKWV